MHSMQESDISNSLVLKLSKLGVTPSVIHSSDFAFIYL
jgi:hypothetical protein